MRRALRFRIPAFLFGPVLVLAPAMAHAQVTITTVVRSGSPRVAEMANAAVAPTDPIGVRDCACESWTFTGSYTAVAGATSVQYWIGTNATACASTATRYPATNATCFPIQSVGSDVVGGSMTFMKTIEARYLVDPLNGQCNPPGGLSSNSTLYFSVLVRPPDDNTPLATQAINFSVVPPDPPYNVTATAGNAAANVSWTVGQSIDDAGATILSPNLRGFYVLCLPRGTASTNDGGSTATCSTAGFNFGDAGDAEASVSVDAAAEAGEAGLDGSVVDGGLDATSGTTSDASSETSTEASTDGASSTACPADLPSTFDPNDDTQFSQYVCSSLLSPTTTSYRVSGLQNDVTYKFFVVTQDNAGNRALSANPGTCARPQPTTNFWQFYQSQGGGAHTGFCSVSPEHAGGARVPAGAIVVAAAGAGLAGIRRRRAAKRSMA